jgi:uncharacterized membrane-anchored protein
VGAILPTRTARRARSCRRRHSLGEGGWAVFLTYTDDGHIDDSDANEYDYDDLLKEMKEGVENSNRRVSRPAIRKCTC